MVQIYFTRKSVKLTKILKTCWILLKIKSKRNMKKRIQVMKMTSELSLARTLKEGVSIITEDVIRNVKLVKNSFLADFAMIKFILNKNQIPRKITNSIDIQLKLLDATNVSLNSLFNNIVKIVEFVLENIFVLNVNSLMMILKLKKYSIVMGATFVGLADKRTFFIVILAGPVCLIL